MSGLLRLGVIPTVAPYLLPAALPRLRKRYPDFRVRLREALTADLVEATRQDDLDLLLLSLDAPLGGLVERPLFDDLFVVALPRGHRLAARKVLTEADLRGERSCCSNGRVTVRRRRVELTSATESRPRCMTA
jgi:LysR family hydrogen peroxide-inducible transcriptional activator